MLAFKETTIFKHSASPKNTGYLDNLPLRQFAWTISPQFLDNSSQMWKHQSYWFTKEKESATALASQSTELFMSIVDETIIYGQIYKSNKWQSHSLASKTKELNTKHHLMLMWLTIGISFWFWLTWIVKLSFSSKK